MSKKWIIWCLSMAVGAALIGWFAPSYVLAGIGGFAWGLFLHWVFDPTGARI